MGFGWSGDCDPQHNHQLPRWRTMSQEDERTRSYSRKLILYRRADKHGIDGEEKMQKQSMMMYRQLSSYRDLLRRKARKLLGFKAFLSEKSKLCKPWWDQARPRTQGQWTGNQIWSISLMFLTVVKAASLKLWFMFLALHSALDLTEVTFCQRKINKIILASSTDLLLFCCEGIW